MVRGPEGQAGEEEVPGRGGVPERRGEEHHAEKVRPVEELKVLAAHGAEREHAHDGQHEEEEEHAHDGDGLVVLDPAVGLRPEDGLREHVLVAGW